MKNFDFVIVGAGTAGCTLAYRLCEKGHSVCVLEAGPTDSNPLIRIPSGIMKTSKDPRITWRFNIEGNDQTGKRQMPSFLGKTLGGSSAVNGMVYNRGQRSDFDNWAVDGCTGWDYESVLPYFKKSERYLSGGDSIYRGRSGPVRVKNLDYRDPSADRFIRGCMESGIPLSEDCNGAEQQGVAYLQAQIHRGWRQFSADTYLKPARRLGAKIVTEALVRKVLVENGRAVGVEYLRTGEEAARNVKAQKGVILSAGTMMSPKLLQLSGIGPAKLLQSLGIPVMLDLPGVGENLTDHFSARVVAKIRPGYRTINELVQFPYNAIEAMKWMIGRPSILALTSMIAGGAVKMNKDDADTAYAMFFLPASLKGNRILDTFPGITGGTWQQRPKSRGYVRIKSAEIKDDPIVYPNYLSAEVDRTVMVAAVKHLHSIFTGDAFRTVLREITMPSHPCRTDDEWLSYIRSTGMTTFHLAGTCRMGALDDPESVVDPRLRLRGIDNFWVIDASIMPTQPSGNLNASVMMISEKGADMVCEDLVAES